MKHKIIDTGDGSKTIFIPEMDEQYHSVNGAQTESEYVFLDKGYRFHTSETPRIFEVGFGTGLNALLTAVCSENQKRVTNYVSIEKYPLDNKTIQTLNYGSRISKEADNLYKKIHDAPWGKETVISAYFNLTKIKADLITYDLNFSSDFDIIYFDAFGPDKQPKMWNIDIFQKIYEISANNAVFVTYSAKGSVRRQLQDCGYIMERLPGPPGKRQMLRGIKKCTKIVDENILSEMKKQI